MSFKGRNEAYQFFSPAVTVMASLSAYSVTEPLGLTLGSQCALETVQEGFTL